MNNTESEYHIRPPYDGTILMQGKNSPKHRSYGDLIRLAPDVAMAFPDSEAVHEALRYLIEKNKHPALHS